MNSSMFFRVLNCGLKLQADGFGLDTEIGILSYLAFIQDEQLKSVLNEMVRVCKTLFSSLFFNRQPNATKYHYFPDKYSDLI